MIKDVEKDVNVTNLETREVDVHQSISIVKESGTDPEDEVSQHKLQCACVSPCRRRRATPITIISVGVNETMPEKGDEEHTGTRRKCEHEPQSACPP